MDEYMMDEYTKEKVLERVENKENNFIRKELDGYRPNEKIIVYEKKNANGLLHCEDGPACYEFYRDEIYVKYYINGNLHRENNPAIIHLICDKVQGVTYLKNNSLHREDGPACITKFFEEYIYEGKEHRTDGPALIHYHDEEKTKPGVLMYYLNGKRHREDGPAIVHLNKNGIFQEMYWYENGEKIIKLGLNTKSARN